MINIYDDEDVKMGWPLYMKFKVVNAEPVFDQDTGDQCGWYVYCRCPIGSEFWFPTEEEPPEKGTEFSIRFDWGDE